MKKLSDCLSLESRNDIYEDEFFKADNYFINKKYYRASRDWNIEVDNISWFNKSDRFKVSNLTQGYHGILKQWWEAYFPNKSPIDVLLTAENNLVKQEFNNAYPQWQITTTDLFTELRDDLSSCDIVCDLCDRKINQKQFGEYDLILSQAIIEHTYDPLTYVVNLCSILKKDGYLFLHTVTPGFPYHAFPRDYFRFFADWFVDLPHIIKKINPDLNLEITELLDIRKNLTKNSIFVCIKRIG